MACAQLRTVVDGLGAKHAPNLKVEQFDASTKEAKKYRRAHQLGSHGLLVYNKALQVTWQLPGHQPDMPIFEGEIQKVLGN